MRRLLSVAIAIALAWNILAPAPLMAASPTLPILSLPSLNRRDTVRGRRNAPVTLIVYTDFECPFCARHHETVMQILRQSKRQVSLTYRNFPLVTIHEKSLPAAIASECVRKYHGSTAFWTFVDTVFSIGAAKAEQAAKTAGVTDAEWQQCIQDPTLLAAVQEQIREVQGFVSGTPTTIVENIKTGKAQVMTGAVPLTTLEEAIRSVAPSMPNR